MEVLQYGQLLFIITSIVTLIVLKSQRKNMDIIRKNVFYYSVIPSLAYSTIGHLFLGKNIRKAMNWGDSTGVITLQRELGITQLTMFIVACFSTNNPQYIGSLWGLMLVLMGSNHFAITKKFSAVGLIDIIYGFTLLGIYSPKILQN